MKTQKNLMIQTVGNNMRCWAHSTSWTFRLEGQGGARGMSLWFLPLALWHLSLGFYVEIQLFGPQVLDRESLHKSAILARLIQHIKAHCWLICFFTYFSEISPAFPGGIHKKKKVLSRMKPGLHWWRKPKDVFPHWMKMDIWLPVSSTSRPWLSSPCPLSKPWENARNGLPLISRETKLFRIQ